MAFTFETTSASRYLVIRESTHLSSKQFCKIIRNDVYRPDSSHEESSFFRLEMCKEQYLL